MFCVIPGCSELVYPSKNVPQSTRCEKHRDLYPGKIEFVSGEQMPESILQEADKLVSTDRQVDYGHPYDNYTDIAKGASVIFGKEVTAEQCALFMIWTKVCRELHKNKRDNLVDIAGYAKVLDMILERRATREEIQPL